ncbi:MAG TPA: SDR family oxidoreductase [Thermoanaerobaculia bacterium]|nr:SDR family oxidoreductase [Thermoanaerobaculia bacterium]
MEKSEFADRVVVVTGASSGIGRATAELFAREGALVAIFARSAEKLAQMAGERVLAVAGDVANEADVEHLFSEVESRFGDCDVLVNNAGTTDVARLIDTTPNRWDRMFAVNVRGSYLATRRALPAMVARRSGAIVNVASISGVIGPEKFPGFVSYCASKAAVIGMTEALAVEVRDAGVRVNCVSPGSVDTPMWAEVSGGAPASMTPEEIAQAIRFLASSESRPMNGQNLNVW